MRAWFSQKHYDFQSSFGGDIYGSPTYGVVYSTPNKDMVLATVVIKTASDLALYKSKFDDAVDCGEVTFFVRAGMYGDINVLRHSLSKTKQEKPCRNCQRPNDLGVKSCWMCGVANP